MPLSKQTLDQFHDFATHQLSEQPEISSLKEMLRLWELEFSSDSVHAAIERGLADVEAGRTKPLDEFIDEFRAKHGIAAE